VCATTVQSLGPHFLGFEGDIPVAEGGLAAVAAVVVAVVVEAVVAVLGGVDVMVVVAGWQIAVGNVIDIVELDHYNKQQDPWSICMQYCYLLIVTSIYIYIYIYYLGCTK
jgi:hypothetical protein